MRLRWGPHASQLAEQVVLGDPCYVVRTLSEQPDGALAGIFRELILAFDARPLSVGCARCGREADGLCAYPASVQLVGFCDRCVATSTSAPPRPAGRLYGYEDAVRHVAASFRRGHRANMRRIVRNMAQAKGAPRQMTEPAALVFFKATAPKMPMKVARRPLHSNPFSAPDDLQGQTLS